MSEEVMETVSAPTEKKVKKPMSKKKLISLIALGVVVVVILVIVLSIVITTSRLSKAGANYASGKWVVATQTATLNSLPDRSYQIGYLDSHLEIDTSNGYKNNAAALRYKMNYQNSIGTEVPLKEEKLTINTTGKLTKDRAELRINFRDGKKSAETLNMMYPISENVAYVKGACHFTARREIESGDNLYVKKDQVSGEYTQSASFVSGGAVLASLSDCKIDDTTLTATLYDGRKMNATVSFNTTADAATVTGTVETTSSSTMEIYGVILETTDNYIIFSVTYNSKTNDNNPRDYISHLGVYKLERTK